MGGRLTFPAYSLYHGTKWAVEGLSEGLQYELRSFGIRVKLVEPGSIKTDFYTRSMDHITPPDIRDYDGFINAMMPGMQQSGMSGSSPIVVARTVYRAATDGSRRMRYVCGKNARLMLTLHNILPVWLFQSVFMRGIRAGRG